MMGQAGLQLNFSGSSAVLVILVAVVACSLSWVAMRRSGFSSAMVRLEILRLSIIGLVLLLLLKPEWNSEFQPETQPRIAVYYDQSPSMGTLDVLPDGKVETTAISRQQSIQPWLDPQTWRPMRSRFDVLVEGLGGSIGADGSEETETKLAGGLTNLSRPLSVAVDQSDGVAGVVLISDGDWNDGPSPIESASKLRALGIPVFTVTAGNARKLPDLELINADVPTFGVAGKPIRIPLAIDSSLPRESVIKARLLVGETEEALKEIRIAPMGRTFDAIQWTPEDVGEFVMTIELPVQKGEKIVSNNTISLPISIRKEQLKVLIVESLPRWEYRYLRNALSRDPGVEVSCLLFHPGLDRVGGGSLDYLKVFPEELEDLSKYDVVFLGDVGVDDSQLTEQQCQLIRGLIEYQASGLVLMPGFQGRQFELMGTELESLYPVVLDESQPEGWGSRLPGHFELTQRGRESLLTKLADSKEENYSVWESLPGFQWYAPVIRAKAGAEILAVHQDMSNASGRLPLLVTRPFGAGKVLFMGTDGAWRWRKGVEDKYHYRFWGQVVRWMAYQRNMAKGESMRLFYNPDQPAIRQTISLNAHVMDTSGEPLQDGEVIASITSPSGGVETVRLANAGDRWGVFRGRFNAEEPGQHQVVLTCKESNAVLETTFFVQGDVNEPLGKPARPEVLEEISRITRGKNVDIEEMDLLMKALADLPDPEPTIRRVQLWAHPAVAGLLLLLLTAFWICRKAAGLI